MIAYLDPGAGSLLIQAVLAGALAIPFFLRSHLTRAWYRLTGRGVDNPPED